MTSTAPASRRRPLVFALVTFFVLAGLVVALASTVWADSQRSADADFVTSADESGRSIERQIRSYFDKLRSIGAFVAAGEVDVPGDDPYEVASGLQFERFVEGTRIFDELPSLAGVLFLRRVEPDALEVTVERLRAGGLGEDFAVFEIGERTPGTPQYLLTYYSPGAVDLALPLGTDISPITSVSRVLENSAETGAGGAGSFQDDALLLDIAARTDFPAVDELLAMDFFIGLPVYAEPAEEVDPARSEPFGWVAAPVANFGDVLDSAAAGLRSDLGVSLTVDVVSVGLEDSAISRVAERSGTAGERGDARVETVADFEVEGVSWRLAQWSAAAPSADSALLVLAGGLVAALLAAAVVYLRLRNSERERLYTQEVADRDQFRSDMLDSVSSPMIVLDADGSIVDANPAWDELRLVPGSLLARGAEGAYLDVIAVDGAPGRSQLASGLDAVLAGREEARELDVPIEHHGLRRWFAVRITPLRGRRGGAVIVHQDITERKRSEAELELKASHDTLTGLLNRAAFESEIDMALARAVEQEASMGVLFLDLDDFKAINDTYGHGVGDEVLVAVADRVADAVRTDDRVARLGGDEFVVLIGTVQSADAVERTAERVLIAFQPPVSTSAGPLPVGVSVGVALVDVPLGVSPAEVIDQADQAMYDAKQRGGRTYSIATPRT